MGMILRKQLLFMLGVTIAFLSNFSTALAYERAVKNLTTTIANDIRGMGKHTIAVVDFTDLRGNVTELGRFIAEEISIDLAMSATGFRVLDRAHMKSILEELALSSSELFDLQKASEVGKLSGADAIVAGSVIPFGDNVRITVKVIATETGRVISAAKEYIAKTRAIEKMLNASIVSDPPKKQPESESPDKKPQTGATWDFETGDLQGWQNKGDAFRVYASYYVPNSGKWRLTKNAQNCSQRSLKMRDRSERTV
jgi:TolB-like protein